MTFQELKDQSDNFTRYEVFQRVQMSPELASMILTLNTNNRKKTKLAQKKYARHMKNGEWLRSGQTIVISKKGVLQDGQHRLEAVVESGMTVEMIVVVGTEYEAFKVIDTGKNRSVTDIISVMEPGMEGADRKNTYRISRFLFNYRNGGLLFNNGNKFNSNLELANFYENFTLEEKEYIELCLGKGSRFSKKTTPQKLIDVAVYAFTYYILSKIDSEKAETFFEAFSSGENISRNDNTASIWAVRDILSSATRVKGRVQYKPQFDIAYIFKAWNLYVDGVKNVTPQKMVIKGTDTFPVPRGVEITNVVTMTAETELTPHEVVDQTIETVKGNKARKAQKSVAF